VRTTTPTGQHDDSTAPPLLGSGPGISRAPADTAVLRSTDPPPRLNDDQRTRDAADACTVDESALERELEQLLLAHGPVLYYSGAGHVPR
jgi:hypothetical protein